MGSSLLGMLVKGPAKLDYAAKAAALTTAKVGIELRVRKAKRLAARFDDKAEVDPLEEEVEFSELQFASYTEAQVNDLAETLVSDLFHCWNQDDIDFIFGDWVSRIDPFDEAKQMVFAGESSWGDEPSSPGYEVLSDAQACGLLEFFGIK